MYTIETVAVTPNEKRGRKDYAMYPKLRKSKAGLKRPNSTEASKHTQHMQRVRAFMLLGGKCYKCPENRMQTLELEHINDNGAEERRTIGRGNVMAKEALKRPNDFQLLCGSCHNLKTSGYESVEVEFQKE